MLALSKPAVVAPVSEWPSTDADHGECFRMPVARSTALVLVLFAGFFGAHNFYLGNALRGSMQLGLCLLAYATIDTGVGIIVVAVLGLWIMGEFLLLVGLIPPSDCHASEV